MYTVTLFLIFLQTQLKNADMAIVMVMWQVPVELQSISYCLK